MRVVELKFNIIKNFVVVFYKNNEITAEQKYCYFYKSPFENLSQRRTKIIRHRRRSSCIKQRQSRKYVFFFVYQANFCLVYFFFKPDHLNGRYEIGFKYRGKKALISFNYTYRKDCSDMIYDFVHIYI